MNQLAGKGMYIWIIDEDESPEDIALACKEAGLSHVAIKIADSAYPYNIEYNTDEGRAWGRDKVPPLMDALRKQGISPWGWVFAYGNSVKGEQDIAIKRSLDLGIDGLIVNAESAYKGKYTQAKEYMRKVRSALTNKMPIALSSFRFPKYHPTFPWIEFLSHVDINMPQVYWMKSHNPADQMTECFLQFQNTKYPQLPIFPTGATFSEHSWRPTVDEVIEFMDSVKALEFTGCNFWLYSHARHRFPEYWDVITNYDWPTTNPKNPIFKIEMLGDLNVRTAPSGSTFEPPRHVLMGERYDSKEFQYDSQNRKWYKIKSGWIAGYTKWTRITEIEDPNPDPPDPPENPIPSKEKLIEMLLKLWEAHEELH